MEASDTEVNGANGTDGAADVALLSPPPVPADVVPIRVEGDFEPAVVKTAHVPMPRRGLASKGNKVQLLTNHFKVNLSNVDGHFFHYSVALYEDGRPVDGKGIGRKVLDRVHDTYKVELEGKDFAYDGEKSLFTVGALPRNQLVFIVVLEDISSNRSNGNGSPRADCSLNENKRKRRKCSYQSKTYKVEIFYVAKIPMQAIAQALCGQDSKNSQEALRVLHIILRQQAAKQGCLLARQSFFLNDVNNFSDVEGGVLGCRGVHSSFRTTQGGLSLNIDMSTSTTMIIQPGPVVDFLIANQNATDPLSLDWEKAKRVLKNLRVKSSATNTEYKITGLSDKICKELMFSMKQRGEKNENKEPLITELSVYDYFVSIRKIYLHYSGDLPCINVGKPKRPTYIPLELCSLVSLQHYTKALTTLQRGLLVEMEKSRQKPQDRMKTLTNTLKINNYADEPLLRACGVSVSNNFTQVEGRILAAPRAKRVLKNLRVKSSATNTEYKITGLSDKICKELMFSMKQRGEKNENKEPLITELSVYDYFVSIRKIYLHYSGDLPCINVGKPKRPTYIPLELCSLVSLQHYTKALTTLQRGLLVEMEKSRQKPQDRMKTLTNTLKINNYADEPLLRACGVSVSNNFTQVEGRILAAPRLRVGNGEDFIPRNGRWNFNNKKLVEPTTIAKWAVVNFSARCNIGSLISDFIKCGNLKGIKISRPSVFEESSQDVHAPPLVRVKKMFECMKPWLSEAPVFLLCLLPERKNSLLYGPWKRMNLTHETVTQCIAPMKVNDQYLTNVLLKINAKLGGLNAKLSIETYLGTPSVSKVPTLILGMYVCHRSPGQSDASSIAAVVGSRQWPLISKYRASVRTQSPKVEMIDSLFKKVADDKDDGIMRELLEDFFLSSGGKNPEQIIIFRNGVSESQFNQVLKVELNQIIEACNFMVENWRPKFVVIIAQKNHHTKFFQPASPDNVPPGTVIDDTICHPRNYDFYLCAQAGMIGTVKPTHYHVLLDEVGFTPDDLQEFVHSLSYVSQRSTTAISVVAPIRYAHLAATQMGHFMKFDDTSESSSSQSLRPQLPRLKEKVCNSMFFV